jgi:hypothetical protein
VGTNAASADTNLRAFNAATAAVAPLLSTGAVRVVDAVAVDCLTGSGIGDCLQAMLFTLYDESTFGGTLRCPRLWNELVDVVVGFSLGATRAARAMFPGPLVTWRQYVACCRSLGFADEDALRQATEFLDVIGVVVYKGGLGRDAAMGDIVVLQPSMLIDAMKCIIAPTAAVPDDRARRQRGSAWCDVCERNLDGVAGLVRKRYCCVCSRVYCNLHIRKKAGTGWVCGPCFPLLGAATATPSPDDSVNTRRHSTLMEGLRTQGRVSEELLQHWLWRHIPLATQRGLLQTLDYFDFVCEAPLEPGELRDGAKQYLVPSICVASARTGSPLVRCRQWEFDVSSFSIGAWSSLVCTLAKCFSSWQWAVGRDRLDTDRAPATAFGAGSGSSATVPAVGPVAWGDDTGRFVRIHSAGAKDVHAGVEVVEVLLCRSGKVVVAGAYEVGEPAVLRCEGSPSREWRLLADVLQRVSKVVQRHCRYQRLDVVCPACVAQREATSTPSSSSSSLPGRFPAQGIALVNVVGWASVYSSGLPWSPMDGEDVGDGSGGRPPAVAGVGAGCTVGGHDVTSAIELQPLVAVHCPVCGHSLPVSDVAPGQLLPAVRALTLPSHLDSPGASISCDELLAEVGADSVIQFLHGKQLFGWMGIRGAAVMVPGATLPASVPGDFVNRRRMELVLVLPPGPLDTDSTWLSVTQAVVVKECARRLCLRNVPHMGVLGSSEWVGFRCRVANPVLGAECVALRVCSVSKLEECDVGGSGDDSMGSMLYSVIVDFMACYVHSSPQLGVVLDTGRPVGLWALTGAVVDAVRGLGVGRSGQGPASREHTVCWRCVSSAQSAARVSPTCDLSSARAVPNFGGDPHLEDGHLIDMMTVPRESSGGTVTCLRREGYHQLSLVDVQRFLLPCDALVLPTRRHVSSPRRFAVVVGVDRYRHLDPIQFHRCVNSAQAMGSVLEAQGFRVWSVFDGDASQIASAVDSLLKAAVGAAGAGKCMLHGQTHPLRRVD